MPKQATIEQVLKRAVEKELDERGIGWVRRSKGLILSLIGNPIVKFEEDKVVIGFISGATSGSKDYEYLEFRHGNIVNPESDPMDSINRAMTFIDRFRDLFNLADNADDIEFSLMTTLPAATARVAFRDELLKITNPEIANEITNQNFYTTIYRNNVGNYVVHAYSQQGGKATVSLATYAKSYLENWMKRNRR